MEEYEFCPELESDNYKRSYNKNVPMCFYEVTNKASWKVSLLNELKKENLLQEILPQGFWMNTQRIFKSLSLETIVKSYDNNCPKNFIVEINNFGPNEVYIYCYRDQWFSCPPDWYRTSPPNEKDFFGCRRYASCKETNPLSYEIDDPRYCALCPGGGCIDHTKTETDWSENKIGYCKVIEANPQQSVECNE